MSEWKAGLLVFFAAAAVVVGLIAGMWWVLSWSDEQDARSARRNAAAVNAACDPAKLVKADWHSGWNQAYWLVHCSDGSVRVISP